MTDASEPDRPDTAPADAGGAAVEPGTPQTRAGEAASTPGKSSRDRLLVALRRPRRSQLVVAVLLAALGLAAATQIRLTRGGDDYSGQRRGELIALLDSLSAAADRTREQIAELEQRKRDLKSGADRRKAAAEEVREQLRVLGVLAGTLPATGPGVTVTIRDPGGGVTAAALLNGVEELRDAGAEAIEINDRVRVVASTAFTDVDGQITVGGTRLSPPYVLDAIGSSHTLSEAVVFRGGLAEEVESLGGSAQVRSQDVVAVTSLHAVKKPKYAQPTDD